MRIRTILIFLLISIYLHLSSSKGIFEVKLVSFISKNIYPIELSICLKEYQTVVEDTGDCRFGKKILNLTKGYLDSERSGNDSYTFLFPFDMPWPKSHSIIIKGRVKDEDDKNEKDSTIIVYKESFLLSGKSNWNVEVITNNNVSMSFLYRIRCDTNYYGMDCSKMCQGAIFGTEHFECDEDGNHICKEGWIGKRCDQPVCKNGCSSSGKCVAPDTCDCFNGYSGKNCEQCIPLPGCQNGYCKNKGNECICEEGWTGHFCEINLVPCKTKNKCKNGGICLNDKDDIIKCECPNGFFGKYCQFKKPTCETHQCKNGGTCVMTSDGSESKPICDCLPMYFGKYCQSEKNLEEDIDIIVISTTEKSLMLQNNNNRTVSVEWNLTSCLIIVVLLVSIIIFIIKGRRQNYNQSTLPLHQKYHAEELNASRLEKITKYSLGTASTNCTNDNVYSCEPFSLITEKTLSCEIITPNLQLHNGTMSIKNNCEYDELYSEIYSTIVDESVPKTQL